MGGGKKRIPSLFPIILMFVFFLTLLLFGARVRAGDGTGDASITVTMPVEISLALDTADALHPVFSGSGTVYGISELATSHRYVEVSHS